MASDGQTVPYLLWSMIYDLSNERLRRLAKDFS